jgi:hypothetical protein
VRIPLTFLPFFSHVVERHAILPEKSPLREAVRHRSERYQDAPTTDREGPKKHPDRPEALLALKSEKQTCMASKRMKYGRHNDEKNGTPRHT